MTLANKDGWMESSNRSRDSTYIDENAGDGASMGPLFKAMGQRSAPKCNLTSQTGDCAGGRLGDEASQSERRMRASNIS